MASNTLAPPTPLHALRELGLPLEIARSLARSPRLLGSPRGRGEPVIVLPGFATGDRSTLAMRGYLRAIGYRPEGWGLGTNRGDVEALMPRVTQRIALRSAEYGGPIHLIGWSLGGVLAREAAREMPDRVRSVITMGTPVVGGPRYTVAARLYAAQGFDFDAIERRIAERERTPIRVPITSFYSKTDGIVAWRAAIDPSDNPVEHVEVTDSHLGMGFSSRLYGQIAERLAASRA
jgi:pimeloyl-ACP methyl ester carboxylesterase